MFHSATPLQPAPHCDVAAVVESLAQVSSRPRYAFMLLNLIAQVARPDGSAGPWIKRGDELVSLRDWLCDALTPMSQRSSRTPLTDRVRDELSKSGRLPHEMASAQLMIAAEVRVRMRATAKSNLSRAVSELVKAGMLDRHYQGYRVDHRNRGGQRHAVYTLIGNGRRLLPAAPANVGPAQGELALMA